MSGDDVFDDPGDAADSDTDVPFPGESPSKPAGPISPETTVDQSEGEGDLGEEQSDDPIEELRPPSVADARFGWFGQLWRTRNWLKKREKLRGKGYVQWYLVDDQFSTPKYVKPERKGGGLLELKHDGERYLFPENAMVPSENGLWTVIHRKGEADPLNLRDPARLSIPTDELEEYLNLRVSSTPPSWWDSLGLDMSDLVKIAIVGIIVFAAIQQTGLI